MKTLSYETAKKLKGAGFPQSPYMGALCQHEPENDSYPCRVSSRRNPECEWVSVPTLSELIEACGEQFGHLALVGGDDCGNTEWVARVRGHIGYAKQTQQVGSTPEEAVANLWLALNH